MLFINYSQPSHLEAVCFILYLKIFAHPSFNSSDLRQTVSEVECVTPLHSACFCQKCLVMIADPPEECQG